MRGAWLPGSKCRWLRREIYFGAPPPDAAGPLAAPRGREAAFAPAAGPKSNQYQLDGTWLPEDEALVLRSVWGEVRVHFSAAKLHLVAAAPLPK